MLASLEALLTLGKCRELPVVGFIKGYMIVGVIVRDSTLCHSFIFTHWIMESFMSDRMKLHDSRLYRIRRRNLS